MPSKCLATWKVLLRLNNCHAWLGYVFDAFLEGDISTLDNNMTHVTDHKCM